MPSVFISAENPDYKTIPMRANTARMYQLYHDLQTVGARNIRKAKFIDKTTGYSENSFHADLPLEQAIRLGKIWGQQSILVEGLGVLNLKNMRVNRITDTARGRAAEKRAAFSIIFGDRTPRLVSYGIDFKHSKRLRR